MMAAMRNHRSARWAARGAVTLSAVALATLALGCSRSGEDDSRRDLTREAPDRQGGHIVLPSNEPRYLNPILETRFDRATLLLFEGLVGLDAQLEPVPRLAESWEMAADGSSITFKLREGVRWHDGQPFTSADVAFTIEALRSTSAQTVWQGYMADVGEVQTPDEHTVIVAYEQPYAPALITWTMGILPKHIYGDADDLRNSQGNQEPVGTGPYRLARWHRGDRMILNANERWWYEPDPQTGFGRPYIDSIELRFGLQDQLGALEELTIDFADVSDISAWRQAQVSEFRENFEVSDVIESRFRAIAWNAQREPFNDPNVRIAISHALHRSRVVDDVLLGQAQPLSAPFFPTMFGADRSIAPYPFDLDRAVKLLDEAGHPAEGGDRFEIDLIMLESQSGPTADQTLAIFRRDLDAIGIRLRVRKLPAQSFFETIVLREYDAVYFGWLPDIPDPDPYPLLHSSQIGSGANFAGLADAVIDDLIEEARRTANREERMALYRDLHARVHELEPYTMLYAPYGHYAWNRRVRGANPSDIGPQPRFPGLARWFVIPAETQTAALR
jgi:peptide/nickel transport system substrate-binding protein